VDVSAQILGWLFGFFLRIFSSDDLFKLSADCSQNNRLGIRKGSGSRKFMHFICWNITIFGKTFFVMYASDVVLPHFMESQKCMSEGTY